MADISITVVLLDTDPYHAMTPLIKIALSHFTEGYQTINISQELSEKLHKPGPCQKLLTTKSDLPKITTIRKSNRVRLHHKKKSDGLSVDHEIDRWGESSPLQRVMG